MAELVEPDLPPVIAAPVPRVETHSIADCPRGYGSRSSVSIRTDGLDGVTRRPDAGDFKAIRQIPIDHVFHSACRLDFRLGFLFVVSAHRFLGGRVGNLLFLLDAIWRLLDQLGLVACVCPTPQHRCLLPSLLQE